eukprot:6341756-Prymnesium_polylepis.1
MLVRQLVRQLVTWQPPQPDNASAKVGVHADRAAIRFNAPSRRPCPREPHVLPPACAASGRRARTVLRC